MQCKHRSYQRILSTEKNLKEAEEIIGGKVNIKIDKPNK